MKKKYIFVIILLLYNCTKTNIREYNNTSELKNKNLKIGLVGFYPFEVKSDSTVGRKSTTVATVNYSISLKGYFKNGDKLTKFKKSGINQNVSSIKVKQFAESYMSKTGSSGATELEQIIEVVKKPNGDNEFKLKNFDIDYIIVGNMAPIFQKQTGLGALSQLFTGLYCLATIGIIPMYIIYETQPEFIVYDKNLNELKRFQYNNTYSTTTAIWVQKNPDSGEKNYGSAGNTIESKVFTPEISEANDEVTNYINGL